MVSICNPPRLSRINFGQVLTHGGTYRPWFVSEDQHPKLNLQSRQTVDQHGPLVDRWFRSSAVRSRIDWFLIFSSAASVFQQKSSIPAPLSASVLSSKFCNDQKGRASGSTTQGSVSGTRTYLTCPKCGKNHPGGGQCQNRLYAFQVRHDQEDSPDVVTVKFDVSLETVSEPFSVSTPVGDPVIA
uniref:Uncharacterized protein n=1 Tax=Solanum tuberosum TaxID=4113 RepID=M1D896_SOLTU